MAGSHGLTSTSSYYSAFEFVNAKNVAAEIGEENAFIDPEAIIAWDGYNIYRIGRRFRTIFEELKEPKYPIIKSGKEQ